MGVYIKGMEMPTSCAVCDWGSYVGNGRAMCLKTSMTEKTDIMSNRRPEWCPLIEVPTPHGRLMDADELYGAIVDKGQRNERGKYRIGEYWELTGREIREVINGQSSIIEAEGET